MLQLRRGTGAVGYPADCQDYSLVHIPVESTGHCQVLYLAVHRVGNKILLKQCVWKTAAEVLPSLCERIVTPAQTYYT